MRFMLALMLLLTTAGTAAAQPSVASASSLDHYQPVSYIKIQHPEWVRSATIYQINTRQFTPEGTFRAAEKELPRLKELGVGILWLMPIHKIGAKNRKGTLGSPYAVQDYYSVNPEFGTLDDLKHFVAAAHAQGMHVILDWVGNHTAWDNVLVQQHPEWYARNYKGDFMPTPWWDWDDIIDLDYSKPALRKYMTDAMVYWVRDVGVDGYRCDAAGFVPLDFWEEARREMTAVKPVFLLAEWQSRDLEARAFDAVYAWSWYDAARGYAASAPLTGTPVAATKHDLGDLFTYYSWNEKFYPYDSIAMTFTSNHDKNAWENTEFEAFGAGLDAASVLSFTGEGMPLIYNGQEAGYNHRLKFFEKDPIIWKPSAQGDLYRKLTALKAAHPALGNAHWGAPMQPVVNSAPAQVLSFVREKATDKLLVVINFSAQPQAVTFKDTGLTVGHYKEYFSGDAVALEATSQVTVPAWGYRVYVRE